MAGVSFLSPFTIREEGCKVYCVRKVLQDSCFLLLPPISWLFVILLVLDAIHEMASANFSN